MSGRKPTFLLAGIPHDFADWPDPNFLPPPRTSGNSGMANHLHFEAAIMSLSIEQIRRTADRVAASHGLDIVEIEYLGGSKQRVLRVFIEQNAEQRARRAEEANEKLKNGVQDEEQSLLEHLGSEGIALDQLAWVTHEDCERFSRDFGTVIDVEDLVPANEYTLEVSSPGLDRRLATQADYERFRSSPVKVRTFTPVAGNRHWLGKLTEVKPEGIVLDLTAKKQKGSKKGPPQGQTVEIAFSNIEKANLAPEIL
jgi:ribosome maturation factor RimP